MRLKYESQIKKIGSLDLYTIEQKEYGRDRIAYPDVTYNEKNSYPVCRFVN